MVILKVTACNIITKRQKIPRKSILVAFYSIYQQKIPRKSYLSTMNNNRKIVGKWMRFMRCYTDGTGEVQDTRDKIIRIWNTPTMLKEKIDTYYDTTIDWFYLLKV